MATNQQPNNQANNNEEEVDLGSLFVIIGKGFSKFFNFIGNIFKGIFHFFISILIFLRSNFLKIAIAAVIGFTVGLFLEVKKENTFGSTLLVEPNFESARQLYNNVNFYNDLVKQKDTSRIQSIFQIDKKSAGSLKKFEIEPIKNKSDIINSYDDFIKSVDTTTVKSYKFEDYKNSFEELDYKLHEITVIATKNDVFDKLSNVILESVTENKYFNRIKELTNENLNRTDSLLRQNLGQVDSLRRVYMQVMVEEAKKQSNGTSIDLGGEKRTTKELELFETNRKLNSELRSIVENKSKKYEVINVISDFQPIGYEIKGVTKNLGFQLAIALSVLVILILLVLKLNTYLNTYKK
ncbi:hypothetical protein [Polaribacter sp. KT 15]|uniref:hypothetical protein n=1 Tax=Polaribacter sp. KT 15 TaxID=1896175 RepID=UPI00090B3E49|nr:hypothetical protein [Polaribacter sp. KT 15]SHM86912.1 hypothetical protein SAMN05720268_1080 [Polaribacter sp. KT 15]